MHICIIYFLQAQTLQLVTLSAFGIQTLLTNVELSRLHVAPIIILYMYMTCNINGIKDTDRSNVTDLTHIVYTNSPSQVPQISLLIAKS